MTTNRAPDERDFIDWDVPTWSTAIALWDRFLISRAKSGAARALELGAHFGGLSLYLAARHRIPTICSDLRNPAESAKPLHARFNVGELITYEAVDALAIEHDDAAFDYVIFKSVLGEVAPRSRPENKPRMMSEVFRILKPGGAALFAENLVGTSIHTAARHLFRKWGKDWGYSTVVEIRSLMHHFSSLTYWTIGLLTPFVPFPRLKRAVRLADRLLEPVTPESWHYVIYGFAVKPTGERP